MGVETLAIIGTAATVLGAGVSAVNAVQQGQSAQAQADYQAKIARNNEIIANQNAAAVQDQARAKVDAEQRAGAQRQSAQRAALAASGVDLTSPSALDVTDATVKNTELASQQDLYQGELTARGYRAQAGNFGAQSQMDELSGANTQSAGYMNAASSFLTGASQVSSKWNSYLRGSLPAKANPYAVGTGGTTGEDW